MGEQENKRMQAAEMRTKCLSDGYVCLDKREERVN
jgi:hypothetical protein